MGERCKHKTILLPSQKRTKPEPQFDLFLGVQGCCRKFAAMAT
jgi:hypothetical protein